MTITPAGSCLSKAVLNHQRAGVRCLANRRASSISLRLNHTARTFTPCVKHTIERSPVPLRLSETLRRERFASAHEPRPLGWPFDTPMPSGLRELPLWPDNGLLPARLLIRPPQTTSIADEIGQVIDLLA